MFSSFINSILSPSLGSAGSVVGSTVGSAEYTAEVTARVIAHPLSSLAKYIMKPNLDPEYVKRMKAYDDFRYGGLFSSADTGEMYLGDNQKLRFEKYDNVNSMVGMRYLTISSTNNTSTDAKPKVAFVYMCGNLEASIAMLENLKIRQRSLQAAHPDKDITLVCQDYRGRFMNMNLTDQTFKQVPLRQDAEDQTELVKRLINQGYQPVVLGHSLGGNVAIWTKYLLELEDENKYKGIKVIADRTFGDLTGIIFAREGYTSEKVQEKLATTGHAPPTPTWEIVHNYADDFKVFQSWEDTVIYRAVSLAETLEKTHSNTAAFTVYIYRADPDNENAHNSPLEKFTPVGTVDGTPLDEINATINDTTRHFAKKRVPEKSSPLLTHSMLAVDRNTVVDRNIVRELELPAEQQRPSTFGSAPNS